MNERCGMARYSHANPHPTPPAIDPHLDGAAHTAAFHGDLEALQELLRTYGKGSVSFAAHGPAGWNPLVRFLIPVCGGGGVLCLVVRLNWIEGMLHAWCVWGCWLVVCFVWWEVVGGWAGASERTYCLALTADHRAVSPNNKQHTPNRWWLRTQGS